MSTINALERGLLVLRQLEESRGQSLAEIHRATGIPKPSLLRILETLEKSRFVWRAIGDGCYRRSISLATRRPLDLSSLQIAESAAPTLEALQRKLIWPSDILIRRGHQLEVIESSRRQSNLGLTRYNIGFLVDMFVSAPGRAYLAWCSDAERADIVELAGRNPSPIRRSRDILAHELPGLIEETRRQGFGGRDPQFGGAALEIDEFDDGLDAIAVPILRGAQVIACINLVWPRKYNLRSRIVHDHLADLQQAAAEIATLSLGG